MKRKPKSPVDFSAVLDTNTGGLTEQYRRGVLAALSRGTEPTENFWRDLEKAVATYIGLQQFRANRPPAKLELKRWRRAAKLATELGAMDPMWPDHLLAAMSETKRTAEAKAIGNEMISTAFKGRKHPYREALYLDVCDLWRKHLHGRLTHSRTKDGEPSGPLIRFFEACVAPILGDDMPKAFGISSIIDRAQSGGFFHRRK